MRRPRRLRQWRRHLTISFHTTFDDAPSALSPAPAATGAAATAAAATNTAAAVAAQKARHTPGWFHP